MKTYKINEAKEMIGQQIPRIIGTLTKVYDRKTGEGKFGPWSLQNGELQDETGVVSIVFSGLPDMTDKRGQEITFRSNQSKKGLTGIVMEENTYNGVTKPQLKVSASALILDGEEIEKTHGGTVEKVEPKEIVGEEPESKPVNRLPQTNGNGHHVDGAQVVRKRLMQYANLRELCDNAASFLYSKDAMSAEDKQIIKDVASCFFIQALREGLADKLPNNKPLAKKEEDLHEEEQIF